MKKWMLLLAAACFTAPLAAEPPSVGLKGYDAVAYFTAGRPIKGLPNINYDFDDTRYLFSTAKNRELFVASPERYTPQYSGLCATGMAHGRKVQADPTVWKIVDGKLFVFRQPEARDKFERDPGLLAKGQRNWQKPP